ncbi:ABC transporter ATP-binding protein [Candidatus Berkelbacteria bacterium]|nr:ABC transporter ATP-binding protein [Candidatus Berkelbacteria bacterium]
MLKVKNLTVEYSSEKNLNDINLTVDNSSVVAVLGENQSGKSLLLKTIANCDSEHGGQVVINHFKAETEPDKAKLIMSYSPEIPDIPKQLTGFEYLELVANIYDLNSTDRISAINNLADILDIKDKLQTTIEYLSFATRKKISVIAAFLADRPVVLLDNPTLFQDYFSQQAIKQLIINRKESCSILVATNDLIFAEDIADKFVFIKNGEIFAAGTIDELSHQAQTKKSIEQIYKQILG